MNRDANDVLEYATPKPAQSRWPFFVVGFVVAELISFFQYAALLADGPIFPFTVLFAPLALILEMVGTNRVLYFSLFVGGPLLYGLYGLLLILPNRLRNIAIAAIAHAVCFAITSRLRGVL